MSEELHGRTGVRVVGSDGWTLLFEWPWCSTCGTYTWAHSHATGKWDTAPMFGNPDTLLAEVGASAGDGPVEVRSAFRRRIKQVHPDQGGSAEEARRVISAYNELRRRGLAA